MNRLNLMHGQPSEWVSRGQFCLVLFNLIQWQHNLFNSTATRVFDKSLARCQKWWPKRHPSSTAGTTNIQLGLSHTNEQRYVSIITMLFSYVRGQQRIDNNEKCRQIAGNFDCHADTVLQRGAYCLMEIIQGFTRSHWMPPSVKCLRGIALAAAMVNKSEGNTQNTNKTQLLGSNYGTLKTLVV